MKHPDNRLEWTTAPIPYRGYLIVPMIAGGFSIQKHAQKDGKPFHVAYAATLDRARYLIDELA
jgi:hypothetical protein